MSISALTPTAVHHIRTPEAMEGPAPDHDGDDKDVAATSAKATPAPTPFGAGAVVDTQA